MGIAFASIALLPGLAFGSFLNVVAARIPLRRSLVSPGSACMACGTSLAWYDNVPLLSFALLRSRCRHCKAAIPWRYPLVEATTAVLVAACVLRFGLTWDRYQRCKQDCFIMHPGPMNRGVEIQSDIADGPQSGILTQVTNGLAVRMAVMYLVSQLP